MKLNHTIKYTDSQEMILAYKKFHKYFSSRYELDGFFPASKAAGFKINDESEFTMIGKDNKLIFIGELKEKALEKIAINYLENLKYQEGIE
jgi:hypothetical protein